MSKIKKSFKTSPSVNGITRTCRKEVCKGRQSVNLLRQLINSFSQSTTFIEGSLSASHYSGMGGNVTRGCVPITAAEPTEVRGRLKWTRKTLVPLPPGSGNLSVPI